MAAAKAGTWLHDLIEVYNELGGTAPYRDVYSLARRRRELRGASWTREAEASIRRTVEDHAETSANYRGRSVFYSVSGHGRGVWGLMPEYMRSNVEQGSSPARPAYLEGVEGILREVQYLKRSRDPRLVEERKRLDDFTCQACGFRLAVDDGKYVIDVHHLRPLGSALTVVVTSIDDLICLCPTCHRIAHSRTESPFSLKEVADLRSR